MESFTKTQFFNYFITYQHYQKLAIYSLAGFVLYFFASPELLSVLAFFVLECTGDDSGAADCAASGSDAGGGGGGGESSDCGCNTTGCSNCSSSATSSGGDGSGYTTSTPFLLIKKSGQFVPENDVMLSAPQSLVRNVDVGKRRYEAGLILTDTYVLPKDLVEVDQGVVSLRLQEIEPEESYIDHISLNAVSAPVDSYLVTDHLHSRLRAFSKTDVSSRFDLTTLTHNTAPLSQGSFSDKGFKQDLRMNTNDELVCVFNAGSSKRDNLTLMVSSWYRDWTAGDFFIESKRVTTKAIRSPFMRPVVGALAFVLGFLGLTPSLLQDKTDYSGDANVLANVFGAKLALAEHPHSSLLVYVWIPEELSYRQLGVVQPRHLKKSWVSINLPEEAVDDNGEAKLMIRSTERHTINDVVLFSNQNEMPVKTTPINLSDANHNSTSGLSKVSKAFNEVRDGQYTHLIPGDVIDMNFVLPEEVDYTHLAFTVGGFYTPLSAAGAKKAGVWADKLETPAKAIYDQYQTRQQKQKV